MKRHDRAPFAGKMIDRLSDVTEVDDGLKGAIWNGQC